MGSGNQTEPDNPNKILEKRSSFYIMKDVSIEAKEKTGERPSHEFFLDSERLVIMAQLVGGIDDKNILELLKSYEGIHKLIYSIGVSVSSYSNTKNINFVIKNYDRINKCENATLIRIPCKTDGTEAILNLNNYKWPQEGNLFWKMAFEFENPAEKANVSMKFYLKEGYIVPEIRNDLPVDFNSSNYKTMISKSLLNLGNNRRLKSAIEKAQKGEHVTIAYIGGSITQGAGATPLNSECYAYKSYLKFKEMFCKNGGDNVHFIKAGVGGTPSELGMTRFERDILRDGRVKPDIVIVEFAVNDADDETKGICYESLILNILSAENKPAVILLFSVFANDWNLQDRLSIIGRHYNLPMVSISDAVVEQFKLSKEEGNVITRRQYFYDIYHPTNDGHTIMADCLCYLFEQTMLNPINKEDIVIDKSPAIGNSFVGIHLLDRKDNACNAKIIEGGFSEIDNELQMVEMDDNILPTAQFPYNWMHTPALGNESFRMTINSRSLILIFKDSGRINFGKADVFVDGKFILTADPHIIGWTHCHSVILYNDETCKEHFVEIKMSSDSLDKCFTILGFGYCI